MTRYSWWYQVKGRNRIWKPDHDMNLIEKERINAVRLGLELVVNTSFYNSSSRHLYTTPSSSLLGRIVPLHSEDRRTVVDRTSIVQNGPYWWITDLVKDTPPSDDMEIFN